MIKTLRSSVARLVNAILSPFGLEIREKQAGIATALHEWSSRTDYPYADLCIDGIRRGWFPIFVGYPVEVKTRYGYGLPANPYVEKALDSHRDTYRDLLGKFKNYEKDLLSIPAEEPGDGGLPFWSNLWLSGLDGVALYSMIAIHGPETCLEIGSGQSTAFVRRAITEHQLGTRIISIDPHPRADIDALCDKVVREPLENTDLGIFDTLKAGDFVLFDGSHRCFMNSDVTVFLLEVLPRLAPGVIIQVHDFHLPYDYPPVRSLHYESEQYAFGAMLLAGGGLVTVLLANRFIMADDSLSGILACLWDDQKNPIPRRGSSLWLVRTDE